MFIHLPNDHMTKERPEDGYPYQASFIEDNDLALGRILEYLSHSPWWREMAVFVTEDDAQGGLDHVDSHRTVLLAAGPYVKGLHDPYQYEFPGTAEDDFSAAADAAAESDGRLGGEFGGYVYERAGFHAV